MKKSRFSEAQIAYSLRMVESGTPVVDVCHQIGISEATLYRVLARSAPPTESAERMDAGPLLRGPGVWRWRPRGQALAELVATATEGRG